MNSKRVEIPDVYRQRKRLCVSNENCGRPATAGQSGARPVAGAPSDAPNDTNAALLLLRSCFPVDKFQNRLPPIILQHQVYSIVKNRTLVDKELNDLKLSGQLRFFHLGVDIDDVCIVFKDDFKQQVESVADGNPIVGKFISSLLNNYTDLCVTKETLLNGFISKEEDITELMRVGLLTVRDIGSWWLSIPRAGEFMKTYLRGRKVLLTMIRKCKYKEIMQQELEHRKLPKAAKLGMTFHIHDLIGAELVACLSTTSGSLLQLKE